MRNEKQGAFLENIVVIVILLVLVQTFLEDLGVLLGWSWQVRKILIFAGLGFDIFFTVEFLTRLFCAISGGRAKQYFLYERGWIDFLASVPLLMLNSGPASISLLAGGTAYLGIGSVLNVLKVVKAVRIARILRLLRVLKIVKQLKNADSTMAQRHVAKLSTIGVTVFIFSVFVYVIIAPYIGLPTTAEDYRRREDSTAMQVYNDLRNGEMDDAIESAKNSSELILIRKGDSTLYSRYENAYYDTFFGPGDYRYMGKTPYGFFFDIRQMNKHQSKDNLLFFVITVIMVIAFILLYSPHFAITVSDPIHVMKKGLEESSYNLEVKIPERYRDDEIFELADKYNEVYLPLKDRSNAEEGGDLVELKMDDFNDLFEDEAKT
jgi:hypothetical protein